MHNFYVFHTRKFIWLPQCKLAVLVKYNNSISVASHLSIGLMHKLRRWSIQIAIIPMILSTADNTGHAILQILAIVQTLHYNYLEAIVIASYLQL